MKVKRGKKGAGAGGKRDGEMGKGMGGRMKTERGEGRAKKIGEMVCEETE